ncbi:hypothetical protein H4J38_10890 [Colwellia sp. BRX10-3]|uniref:hypothetical protein n=1 Tax=Colwellia sp. BRX10-3 TaxID=2759844 RepID=UPI0015F4A197|nr:hypothetical protein [Colwellia sp. BRX10-3]MBA6391277.1 hypothetical protein [Colwellia sp. BRX10-3]
MVRKIIEHHLAEPEKQFQAALLLREKLRSAINDWLNKPDKVHTGHMICHLIEGESQGGSAGAANQGDNHGYINRQQA